MTPRCRLKFGFVTGDAYCGTHGRAHEWPCDVRAGHVRRLGEEAWLTVAAGDRVRVARADARPATFTVTAMVRDGAEVAAIAGRGTAFFGRDCSLEVLEP